MTKQLQNKIEYSIDLLRRSENLALKYQDYGFYLAFSGGKDSIVLYNIAKMAGVKFKPFMSVTTIDPPELMKFVRKNYPDVTLLRPEINFYKLIIKKKMLPTRMARYCCQYLKEGGGENSVVLTGIRKAESVRRSKRNEFEISGHKYSNTLDQFNIDNESKIYCINGKDKIIINPIIEWTETDIWEFIKYNNIKYCNLYDNGYKRIGCVFCPMCKVSSKRIDRKNYPGIEKAIKKSIKYLMDNDISYHNGFTDENDVFDWWVSNMSAKEYFWKKKQTTLF